jgi:hypothetical protein
MSANASITGFVDQGMGFEKRLEGAGTKTSVAGGHEPVLSARKVSPQRSFSDDFCGRTDSVFGASAKAQFMR